MNKTYTEYIDSDYRLDGTSSNFTYHIYPPKNYNKFSLVSCSIPKTFYMIQDGYNTFIVEENGVQHTITIPIGNYSQLSFKTKVLALLVLSCSYTYAIERLPQTFKYNITVTGNAGIQPKFIFPSTSILYRNFGFNFGSTNTFSADTLTSVNIPLFQHTNVIFVRSNMSETQSSSLSGNIIGQVNCSTTPFMSSINYQVSDPKLQGKDFDANKKSFTFYITDADGFILDLNGIPINLELVFYDDDNSGDVIKSKAILDNLDSVIQKYVAKYNQS